ncbi:MAG: DnaA regulatory inactivator Hda, partial [Halioglobus sp.]|nr:DnaA regulatory inactivator Hda [Halioglobus sp.]
DDLQAVRGNRSWEEALFHLCNRARAQDCCLVVAADAPPRALGLQLADLQSRLSAGLVFQLGRADDRTKAEILQFRAQRRGLTLADDAARFIVARAPRSLDQLLALLDRLDHASLAAQRGLSIPFVKSVLDW